MPNAIIFIKRCLNITNAFIANGIYCICVFPFPPILYTILLILSISIDLEKSGTCGNFEGSSILRLMTNFFKGDCQVYMSYTISLGKFWKAFKELEKTELKNIMVWESQLIFPPPWILLTVMSASWQGSFCVSPANVSYIQYFTW